MREFVECRVGSLYLGESHVPLGHLVREYQHGESLESIRSHYPTSSLEQVCGAITSFLGHKSAVEGDIAGRERKEEAYSAAHPAPPDLKVKLKRVRQQMQARRTWTGRESELRAEPRGRIGLL